MTPATFGFPRSHRLTNSADFQFVFDNARKSSDNYLTVLARANDRGQPRLGLAISRKSIRNAVDRNRIKRLVRESFRLKVDRLSGVDFVVMARTAARQADNQSLSMCLEKHWIILIKRCDSY